MDKKKHGTKAFSQRKSQGCKRKRRDQRERREQMGGKDFAAIREASAFPLFLINRRRKRKKRNALTADDNK